ncbi:DUF4062 domain-containing protein [Mesorhizobium sp. M0848]|uniref:DUF4062 domain-containing protein n=1 Tax=Mesorhizobium sp. M0848 TaxID=2957012 RepID=UPI00333B5B11
MDVKYQVFVSSTYADLIDERRSVIESILNMGHIPVGMEAFQASDDSQWDYIKRRIDDSDYYVLIVAERYGSELKGKSYTQMEYEYAVCQNVPTAAFLLESMARKIWPAEKVEFEKKAKLERFRRLCEKKLVKYWRNKDDLAGKVAMALNELTRQKPRTGWVRADNLPSAQVLAELALLSEEKRSLQQQVERLTGEDVLTIPGDYMWRIRRLEEESIESVLAWKEDQGTKPLLDLFLELDFVLVRSPDTDDLKEHFRDFVNYELEVCELESVMNEYVKHGLLDANTIFNGHAEPVSTYHLTDRGKQFLMYATEWRSRKSAAKRQEHSTTPDSDPPAQIQP